MIKELSFFKMMFFVLLSFFLSALIIFLFIFIDVDDYSSIHLLLGGTMGLSFIAMIFFLPVLLTVAFCQYWIKNYKLKNLISFLLMETYGYLLFIQSMKGKDLDHQVWFKGDTVSYFLISIPATILFLASVAWFISRAGACTHALFAFQAA